MKDNCIFCDIINHRIKTNILLDTNEIISFNDINPQAPTHILIIPKKHLSNILEITHHIVGQMYDHANKIAKDRGFSKTGFRYVINTGQNGGQTVNHLHMHLLGGRKMNWPPG